LRHDFFDFAHPADGDPNVVIEAYAEDDSDPALASPVIYRESDSDAFPSGDVDLTIDRDNEVYATPRTIDTDSLSYRFRATVATAGSDAYVDPDLDTPDTDIDWVGTSFGAQVKLSAVLAGIDALRDDQELYLSGWMFNTASTTASVQDDAVRSAKIRRSVPAGFIRNELRSAWLEQEVVSYEVLPEAEWVSFLAIRAFWNLASADVTQSLKLELSIDAGAPSTTKVNTPDKDGNVRGFGGAPMGAGPSGPMRQSRRLGRAPPAGGGPAPADDE
jgi:hypothetical protein